MNQQLKPTLYDGSVIGKFEVIVVPDSENTLMHAEESRSKMIAKQNDPQMIEKKVITKPIDYAMLNQLLTDFNTRFVPQTASYAEQAFWSQYSTESYAEQAFWSQYSVQTDEPTHSSTTIVEVPKELPKVSMRGLNPQPLGLWRTHIPLDQRPWVFEINELKAQIQEKDTVIMKLKEKLKSSSGDVKERKVERDVEELETLNLELVHKKDTLSSNASAPTFAEFFEINDLKAQAQAKDTVILNLKEKLNYLNSDVKDRHVKQNVEESETLNIELEQCDDLIKKVNLKSAEVSDLNARLQEKVLVDVTPVVSKLRKNRMAYIDYIWHTQGEAATLRKIVESKRLLSPLNTSLNYACKYTRRIQELLVILQQTYPYLTDIGTIKKSKSVKTPVIRKIWKTTGKVFKTVGHIWKPTGRTFTLVGNVCPLTRIATPTIVPPREPIPIVNKTDKPVVTLVYSRKPKSKNVSNKMEPNNSWGSSSSNVASSLSTCRLSKSSSGTWTLAAQSI
nr:hypothetical protein [Tanacetum cinerariifolium]